jgi:hypothetical protein
MTRVYYKVLVMSTSNMSMMNVGTIEVSLLYRGLVESKKINAYVSTDSNRR